MFMITTGQAATLIKGKSIMYRTVKVVYAVALRLQQQTKECSLEKCGTHPAAIS